MGCSKSPLNNTPMFRITNFTPAPGFAASSCAITDTSPPFMEFTAAPNAA
jgi:hypothetical protein